MAELVWDDVFERVSAALIEGHFAEAAAAVATELSGAGDADRAALKRFARVEDRRVGADPWRIEVVLRRVAPELRGRATGRLLRAAVPRLGVAEPALELRVYAIARRILEALDTADLDELPADVAGVRGAVHVWWYMSGTRPAAVPTAAIELRALAASTRVVCDMLEPMGLLTRENSAARRARSEELWALWEARNAADDPFVRDLDAGWESVEPLSSQMRQLCIACLRGEETRSLATGLLSALALPAERRAAKGAASTPPSPGSAAAFGRWCAEASAVGIVCALELDDRRLRTQRGVAAGRLCGELPRLLRDLPLSLVDGHPGFLFWRALTLLARERRDAGAGGDLDGLLADAAETGSWTRARTPELAALISIAGEARALALIMRLGVTTARHRHYAASRMWRHGGAQSLSAASTLGPSVERWWRSEDVSDVGVAEAVQMTKLCAAGELPANADASACAAWWGLPEQRAFAGEDGPAVVRLVTRLNARPSAPPVGPRRMCLAVHELAGRHGETYLLCKAFGVVGGSVAALLEDDLFPRRFDQTRELETLRAALDVVRRAASSGPPPAARIAELREALGALASRRFWTDLGGCIGDTAVELSVADASLPWELAPVGEALALTAPTFRRRGGPPDLVPWSTPAAALIAVDPDDPDARDEARAIEGAIGLPAEVVTTAAELRRALGSGRFELLHFAGHQGPAHDGTPALWLADGGLPLRELCDVVHDAPPRLMFFHGCSTLRASHLERDGVAEQLVFGALEPLLTTRVPVIAGTLWDVTPPDQRFAATFYTELGRGAHPVTAMHAARCAVATSLSWTALWPAYVIASP